MKVYRCGQKKPSPTGRWTDAEILQACWELDEQHGMANPMKRQEVELDIPILTPIPINVVQDLNGNDHG